MRVLAAFLPAALRSFFVRRDALECACLANAFDEAELRGSFLSARSVARDRLAEVLPGWRLFSESFLAFSRVLALVLEGLG